MGYQNGPLKRWLPLSGKEFGMTYIVENLKSENFKASVLDSGNPVLIDFWAEWCGPCRVYGPVVERAAERYAGKLRVVKVNVEDAPDIAEKYGVSSIPTTLILRNGEEVERIVGAVSDTQLDRTLAKFLA